MKKVLAEDWGVIQMSARGARQALRIFYMAFRAAAKLLEQTWNCEEPSLRVAPVPSFEKQPISREGPFHEQSVYLSRTRGANHRHGP